jgi:hypothetical protein
MSFRHLLAVLITAMLPLGVSAQVRVNEIAWMGGTDSANSEWIELYNTGDTSVPLAGWKITSSTGVPLITLTGTVAAGGFHLLTRSSTSIIPGVIGDQSYTGALSNTGATLTLTDSTGAAIDTVVGGANWATIGGDNTTKHTPQRTESGWVTASPTPKALTVASGEDATTTPDTGDTTASTTPVTAIGGTTPSTVFAPIPKLSIYVGNNRIVSTHADLVYTAIVYSSDSRRLGVPVTWTFGDGTQASGSDVRHIYTVPGTYLVVVRTEDAGLTAITTLTVVVREASVSIAADPGGIAITNKGSDILDLSEWQIEEGGKQFRIPRDTAILPDTTVVFSRTVTGLETGPPIALRYPTGVDAATAEVPVSPVIEETIPPSVSPEVSVRSHVVSPAPEPTVLLAAPVAALQPREPTRPVWNPFDAFLAHIMNGFSR